MARTRTARKVEWLRPSEIFAARLRETREARGMSQEALAQRVTSEGRPLSKAALLRIEKGKTYAEGGRGLQLDEALALAHALYAAPSHLLSPPDEALLAITDNFAMDATSLRDWLTLGLRGLGSETQREDHLRVAFQRRMAQLAVALVDAARGDEAGAKVVLDAIVRAVDDYRREVAREGGHDG